jgi:hypothetical protein
LVVSFHWIHVWRIRWPTVWAHDQIESWTRGFPTRCKVALWRPPACLQQILACRHWIV